MISALRSFSSGARDAITARPDRVRTGVEIALAAALAVQLGQLVWIAVEPRDVTPAPPNRPATPPADPSVFQRFDAFFRTGGQSSMAEATSAGSGQMRLYGVRAGGPGGGSAIIGLADGRQISVGMGEEIEPGLILQGVAADHVTVARGPSLSRLTFSDIPVGVAPPPPPPPGPQTVTPPSGPAPAAAAAGPSTAAEVDPARLIAQAGLRPRMRGLRLDGFTVSGGGDGTALRAAGLRPGDVILAVNGQPLDSPQRIAGLRGQLTDSPSAELRYERDGAVRTTTIRTRP